MTRPTQDQRSSAWWGTPSGQTTPRNIRMWIVVIVFRGKDTAQLQCPRIQGPPPPLVLQKRKKERKKSQITALLVAIEVILKIHYHY